MQAGLPKQSADGLLDSRHDDLTARWKRLIGSAPRTIDLPFDRPRPRDRQPGSARLVSLDLAVLDGRVRQQFGDAIADQAWLAALLALLHRYSGATELLVGSPATAGQVRVWRVDVAASDTFDAIVRATLAAADGIAASPLPLDWVIAARSGADAGAYDAPLFHGGFVGGGGADGDLRSWSSCADLTLHRRVGSADDSMVLMYDPELFSAGTATRMAGHLRELMKGALDNPQARVDDLPLLDPDERRRLLHEWQGPSLPLPDHALVAELIADHARRTPDAPAVVDRESAWTFRELDQTANRLAADIIAATGGRRAPVGVCLERSADCVVAQLAVFKTGNPLVLMNPEDPHLWLRGLAAGAGAVAIVGRGDATAVFDPARLPVIPFDRDALTDGRVPADPPAVAVAAGDVDVMVGTSGSTGRPKIVVSSHAALNNLILCARTVLGASPGSRATWICPPGYGYCRVECWAYLANGCTVHVADAQTAASPENLRLWLLDCKATHTSLMAFMAERLWRLPWPDNAPLQVMQVTGEPLSAWPSAELGYEVYNNYGSTETTTIAALPLVARARELPPAERRDSLPPAGRPVPNVRAYVLDARGRPLPIGVVGELAVAGPGLALGYTDPALTATRFVSNTLLEESGEPVFLSRDAARWNADGTLEILGRLDDELKIFGTRVDLAKVKSVIAGLPEVEDAAVIDRTDARGAKELVAYVVPRAGLPANPRRLRRDTCRHLPAFMVPTRFVPVTEIPLLRNGKLDRQALPVPTPEVRTLEESMAPRGLVEEALADIWSRHLQMPDLAIDDNFFDLGGHSIMALEVIAEIERTLGASVDLSAFKTGPTLAALARHIERRLLGAARVDWPSAARAGQPMLASDPQLRFEPFPLTDMQQALWIGRRNAVEFGGFGCLGYFEWESAGLDVQRLQQAWRRLIDRHDMLRAVFTHDGRQRVLPEVQPYEIETVDLRHLEAAAAQDRLSAIRHELSHMVLPSDRWPLFRVVAVVLSDGVMRVMLAIDLLIIDAWSYFQILVPDLVEFLKHPNAPSSPLAATFRDYVLSVSADLETLPHYAASRDYWLARLSSLPPAPALPRLAPTHDRRPRFISHLHRIDGPRWSVLKAHGYQKNLTPTTVLVGAFCEVLGSWSANTAFTLNFPIFDRRAVHPDILRVVGDFTNTLLVAVRNDDATFAARCEAIQQQLWQDLEHRHFSGVRVIRELMRLTGGGVGAVMPIVVTSLLDQPIRSHADVLGRQVFAVSQTPQVLLDFQIREVDGVLEFNWDALDDVLQKGVLNDMFAAYCDLLARLADDPTTWNAERFEFIPPAALERRAVRGNADLVLDVHGRPTPDWVPGEVFRHDPVATRGLVRTGRTGRYLPDGTIEVLPSLDDKPTGEALPRMVCNTPRWSSGRTAALEMVVTDLCQAVLEMEEIGLDDNLFHLGADSLTLTRVCGRLRELFDVDVLMNAVFERPSVAGICDALVGQGPSAVLALAEQLTQLTALDMQRLLDEAN